LRLRAVAEDAPRVDPSLHLGEWKRIWVGIVAQWRAIMAVSPLPTARGGPPLRVTAAARRGQSPADLDLDRPRSHLLVREPLERSTVEIR